MLDAACPGQVFTSPTPDQMVAAAAAVDSGAGRAVHRQELCRRRDEFRDGRRDVAEGSIATVVTNDDVAVERSDLQRPAGAASPARWSSRRSSAPPPRRALDLAALQPSSATERQRTHALDGRRADQLHRAGRRQADLHARRRRDGDGRRHPWRARPPARQAAPRRCHRRGAGRRDPRRPRAVRRGRSRCCWSTASAARRRWSSTSCTTPPRRILERRGLTVARSLVGTYVTSLEMAGCSITVTQLDDRLRTLWDDPVHTAALRW